MRARSHKDKSDYRRWSRLLLGPRKKQATSKGELSLIQQTRAAYKTRGAPEREKLVSRRRRPRCSDSHKGLLVTPSRLACHRRWPPGTSHSSVGRPCVAFLSSPPAHSASQRATGAHLAPE